MQIGNEEGKDGHRSREPSPPAVSIRPEKYAKSAADKHSEIDVWSPPAGDDQDGWANNDDIRVVNPLLPSEKESTPTTSGDGLPSKSARPHRANRQPFFGKFRFCIALMLALATYSYTSMRMNLSMAMVCMVNSSGVHIRENEVQSQMGQFIADGEEEDNDDDARCPIVSKSDMSKSKGYRGTLEWSTAQQARLFGATFYGSFFTVWFSGYLADRFGAKLLIALAIADYSLVSLLTPWFVSIHYNVFFAARIIMGLGEGFVMPTLASASARWFPPAERSLMVAICTLGNQIAALSALLLSSRLCALELLGGWPTIFYTFGLMGMLCLAIWVIFSSDSPEKSRWIGKEEGNMIDKSLGNQRGDGPKRVNGPIPYRRMAFSLPLYAGILGQTTYTFGNVILQSYLPTFFKEVVQLDLKNNGLFSVIPFVGMIFSKIIFGILADQLKKRNILSGTNTVKVFQCFANFGAAFAAISMAFFATCQTPSLAAIFMAIWGISYGASTSGFLTQLISIGPNYSGTISSLATAMGILASGISPIVVSAIVRHGTSREWRLIWLLLAGSNIICALFFLLFASAKVQNWAVQPMERIESIEIGGPKLAKIVR